MLDLSKSLSLLLDSKQVSNDWQNSLVTLDGVSFLGHSDKAEVIYLYHGSRNYAKPSYFISSTTEFNFSDKPALR